MKSQYQLMAILSVVMGVLSTNADRFTTEFNDARKNGQLKLISNTNILRKAVSPAPNSSTQLLDSETKKIKNISDFSGTQLNSHTALYIGEIAIGYATNANTGREALVTYNEVPTASFRNSRFIIKQRGAIVFTSPLSVLTNPNVDQGTAVTDNFVQLDVPFVLAGGIDFSMEIEWSADAVAAATGTEYLEIALKGYETVRAAA